MGYSCIEIRNHVNIKVYVLLCISKQILLLRIFSLFSKISINEKNLYKKIVKIEKCSRFWETRPHMLPIILRIENIGSLHLIFLGKGVFFSFISL